MGLRPSSHFASTKYYAGLSLVLFVLTILALPSCSAQNNVDSKIALFTRTVESCICNYLDIEDDNPSGLNYEDFVEDCNSTVRESHPNRFTELEDSEPTMESLRCPEKVESWLEVVAEQKKLRENNRKLMQEFLDNTSVEDANSATSK